MINKILEEFEELSFTIEDGTLKGCKVYHEAVKGFISTKFKELDKELIICSAVKAEDGTIYRGHRHGDAMRACAENGRKLCKGEDQQGFITSKNRYVGRQEARKIFEGGGFKSADPDGFREDTLFSEDLY